LTNSETIERVLRTDLAVDLIEKSTYQSWFTWVAGDESNAECYDSPTLSLVDEKGAAIPATDELVRLKSDGNIEITPSKLSSDTRTIQLKVTSKGGVSVSQKIDL